MPAKVIRIIARLNVGGPAKHVVWLTDGLEKARYQTLLVSGRVPPGEGDMGYFAEQSGVSPCFIPEMSREISLNDVATVVWTTSTRRNKRVMQGHRRSDGLQHFR